MLFVEVLGLYNAIKEEKIACLRYHLLLQKTDDKNYGYIKPGRFDGFVQPRSSTCMLTCMILRSSSETMIN